MNSRHPGPRRVWKVGSGARLLPPLPRDLTGSGGSGGSAGSDGRIPRPQFLMTLPLISATWPAEPPLETQFLMTLPSISTALALTFQEKVVFLRKKTPLRGCRQPSPLLFKKRSFSENIRKKCSDLKPGFWKGFPTEIIITRQPYNRKKIADKLSIYQGLGYKSRWVQKIRGTRVDETDPPPEGLFSGNILFRETCRFHNFGHEWGRHGSEWAHTLGKRRHGLQEGF